VIRVIEVGFRQVISPEGGVMIKDGFPHAVAVWLGMAFATGLSFLVAFAFGGFPLP
jgi:hypothetical protein